jgi:hypothetical protein
LKARSAATQGAAIDGLSSRQEVPCFSYQKGEPDREGPTSKENDMNENTNTETGFFDTIIKDDGVHRAAAGVVVAVVVAGAKYALFGKIG